MNTKCFNSDRLTLAVYSVHCKYSILVYFNATIANIVPTLKKTFATWNASTKQKNGAEMVTICAIFPWSNVNVRAVPSQLPVVETIAARWKEKVWMNSAPQRAFHCCELFVCIYCRREVSILKTFSVVAHGRDMSFALFLLFSLEPCRLDHI